jgi:acyl carrier protein
MYGYWNPLTTIFTWGHKKMSIRAKIIDQFNQVAREQDRQLPRLTDETPLLESGLDSLCFAIVVARLEDSLGVDPFTSDDVLFPATFGEFVSVYEHAPN